MATPFLPRDDFEKYMRELESRLSAVEKRDPLINSGLSVPAVGVTQVDGNLVVQGEFTAVGKINNNALVAPVSGSVGNVSGSNFSLGANAYVELAGQDITVPAGFTQCLVSAGSTMFSYNQNTMGGSNGAGGDALYCYVAIAGYASHPNPVGVSGSGGYATTFSAAGFQLTGLTPGSTIRLSVYGCSAYQSLSANSQNYANAYASLVWLR